MNRIKGIILTTVVALTLPAFANSNAADNAIREYKPAKIHGSQKNTLNIQLVKQLEFAAKNTEAVVKTSTSLQSIAYTAAAFNNPGKGDVSYWMRTAVDYARTARAMGEAYLLIAARIHNGPIQAAITSAANQLVEMQAGTRGDVYYWKNRANQINEKVQANTDQIVFLAYKLDEEFIHTHTALRALVILMTSTDFRGDGDVYYWVRVNNFIASLSRNCGKALEHLTNSVPEPLYTVLFTYVNQLKKISAAGDGDVDFWARHAKEISTEIDDIGQSVLMVSKKV